MMKKRTLLHGASALVALALAPLSLHARVLCYGPAFDEDGNVIPGRLNVYEVEGADGYGAATTWYNQYLKAISRVNPLGGGAVTGNLASSTSAEKNAFLSRLSDLDSAWIGLTDSEEPEFGAIEAGTDPNGPWIWTDGSPFSYQNFGAGEPNDSGGEDAVHIRPDGFWNDHKSGEPGQPGSPDLRAIFEYDVQIPIEFVSAWEVTTYKPFQPAVDSLADVDLLIAGDSPFTGRNEVTSVITRADLTGGPHYTFDNPYPAGIGGDDFAIVGRGILRVTEPGDYTFGIGGDDGGRLRIDLDQNGTFDGGLEDVIIDDTLHGNIDYFGEVYGLAAGDYAFEWVGFERGGGDGWSCFVSQGTRLTFGEVQNGINNTVIDTDPTWFPLGDPASGITTRLPGDTGEGIEITGYQITTIDVSSFANADLLINNPDLHESFTVYLPVFDIFGTGGNGNFGAGEADQEGVPGWYDGDVDDFAVVGRAWIQIPAGMGGDWTFIGNSDDGQRLRLDFDGDGMIAVDGSEDVFEQGCCTDGIGVANLAEGTHLIEYMFWENGGGSRGELAAAPGFFSAFDPVAFRLVGDSLNGGLRVYQTDTPPQVPVLQGITFTSREEVVLEIADSDDNSAIVDESTVVLLRDGVEVPATVAKAGSVTTLTHTFDTEPAPYVNYTFTATGTTTAGTGAQSFAVTGQARSAALPEGELRAGLDPPPNASTGWDMLSFIQSDFPLPLTQLAAGEQGYRDALAVIADGFVSFEATVPFVNHADPDSPDDRGEWLPESPVLNDVPGTDDDQYVTYSRTTLTIPGPGDYTFRVRSDDGGALRIVNAEFTGITFPDGQAWRIDPLDSSVVFHPAYGGNREVNAVCNFPAAGDYLVEYFVFEGGGGSYQEVSWAPGAFTGLNQTTEWTLVGDASQFVGGESKWGDLPASVLPPLSSSEPGWATRIWYGATVGDLINTTNFIRGADPAAATEVILPELNHSDDGGGGGVFNPNEPFPGDPSPGGDTNDIGMIAHARLVAPVSGDYTLQVRSDDGFLLRFLNPANTFSSINGGGTLHPNFPSEVYFPIGTGDSNTRATINLPAGQHEVAFVWWEGGGGAHFEISTAPGDVPTEGPEFVLLSTTPLADNLYVGSAAGSPLRIVAVSLDEGAGEISFSWSSNEGTNYVVEYSLDLVTWVEIDDGYPADPGDTTTFTFSGDGVADPGTSPEIFFRVGEVGP